MKGELAMLAQYQGMICTPHILALQRANPARAFVEIARTLNHEPDTSAKRYIRATGLIGLKDGLEYRGVWGEGPSEGDADLNLRGVLSGFEAFQFHGRLGRMPGDEVRKMFDEYRLPIATAYAHVADGFFLHRDCFTYSIQGEGQTEKRALSAMIEGMLSFPAVSSSLTGRYALVNDVHIPGRAVQLVMPENASARGDRRVRAIALGDA